MVFTNFGWIVVENCSNKFTNELFFREIETAAFIELEHILKFSFNPTLYRFFEISPIFEFGIMEPF